MLSSGFMDWMKRASFSLRLKLYLELAKSSGLAVLSNCRYVCSRCLSMLGHSGINIASSFSNIHLSTRACDFVYHICSHVQRYFIFHVEELPNSTTFIQNYNFKFCCQRIVPHRFINNFLKAHIIPDIRDSSSSQQDSISNVRLKVVFCPISTNEILIA